MAKVTVTVPAGSRLARFATYDADYAPGIDIDLFVYNNANNAFVAQSAGGTAEESVTLTAAGTYDIYVVLFTQPGNTTGAFNVLHHAYVVAPGAIGNLTATPSSQSVTTAVPATVTVGWNGLVAGTRYLGQIQYTDGTDTIGNTIVEVAP